MSKHFTFIRKICSLMHLQYLCEELYFAVAFCEYEAYQGAASRCRAMLFRGNSLLSACAALRARQPPCSKCAHRKVRFSVAGIKLYLGAASRCRAMLYRGNSPLSACAALRARQSPCSKCAHRKVRFSVAGNHIIVFFEARFPSFCGRTPFVIARKKRAIVLWI